MDDTVLAYTRAALVVVGVLSVVYVVATNQPNAAASVGIIVAAVGSLVGLLQAQATHAMVRDIHAATDAGRVPGSGG